MYLEHANITVASLEKAVHFLTTAFPDFAVRGEGRSDNCHWLHLGDQTTYIALQQNHQITATQDEQYVSNGVNHLGFVVDNLADIESKLIAAGYQKDPMSTQEQYRNRSYFYDGNNVEWEFIEYLSDQDKLRNKYEEAV